ncbi:MAG: hypothetical protein E7536_03165 [Ruminococcaceae bacterium]|nr:hypothetical protein [Oscillospiraceae bacterium]
MKKTLSLILALALCLSLCACGRGNETQSGNNGSSDETIRILLNEPFTIGEYEFTITNWEFVKSLDTVLLAQLQNTLSESDTYIKFDFSIKYIGKEAKWGHTLDWYSLDYNNGFILTDGHGVYADDSYSSGWRTVSVSTEFQPLSEALTCKWFFSVNSEVETNENAPLMFVIDIDGEKAILNLR